MDNKNELVIKQVFNAPRELIWQAWTDPEMLKQWWGPNNVTIPECEVNLQIGGKFYIVMEAGEAMGAYKGTRWPMLAKFTVIEPNSKLFYDAKAWTDGQKEETTIEQTTEITLIEEGEKTKIKIKATIHKAGPGAKMAVDGMQYGFAEQLNKLDKFLTTINNQ